MRQNLKMSLPVVPAFRGDFVQVVVQIQWNVITGILIYCQRTACMLYCTQQSDSVVQSMSNHTTPNTYTFVAQSAAHMWKNNLEDIILKSKLSSNPSIPASYFTMSQSSLHWSWNRDLDGAFLEWHLLPQTLNTCSPSKVYEAGPRASTQLKGGQEGGLG